MIVESWSVGVCVPSRVHNDHTFFFFGTMDKKPLFLYLFFLFTQTWHLVHGHGHGHGLVLDVGVVGVVDQTCGWTCGAPKDVRPLRRRWSLYWYA